MQIIMSNIAECAIILQERDLTTLGETQQAHTCIKTQQLITETELTLFISHKSTQSIVEHLTEQDWNTKY